MNQVEEIEEHFEKWYPKEGCGVLAAVKGETKWFPCDNVAEGENDFVIDSKQYINIGHKADIIGIVHSHPDGTTEPSENDIKYCNAIGIPYYIFSYPDMDMHLLEPEKNYYPLMGREYKFGIQDCFEAARDYYRTEVNLDIPAREPFEDDWWLKDLDYFTEDYISTWGFKKVDNPQKDDLLIFAVNSKIGNHCGVFLGNDIFFHHATQRLSCRENLYPFWIKHLIGIYRYET